MSDPYDDPTPGAPSKRPPPAKPGTKPTPVAKAAAQPAAPTSPTEMRLNWGHIGSVTRPGRLSDGTSRPGVIRVVEANIGYDAPPLDPYIWVSASLNFVGQY